MRQELKATGRMNRPDRELLRELFETGSCRGIAGEVPAAASPPPPAGRTIVVGAGKAAAAMAKAVEDHWPRHRSPASSSPATATASRARGSRWSRRRTRCPTRRGARPLCASWRLVKGLTADDLVLCSDLGRRLRAARCPCRRPHARRQAGDQQGPAQVRRQHHRDELRAQAPLGDQGRAPRCGRRAGPRRDARDLRRAGRRSVGDRIGPDRARSHHVRRRARACLPSYGIDEPRAAVAHLKRGRDETPKPGDPRLARAEVDRHRHAQAALARRGGGGARRRGRASDSRRCDRRRGARRRQGTWPASRVRSRGTAAAGRQRAAVRPALRRRDDRDGARRRARRTQRRVPARARGRARRLSRHRAIAGDTDGIDGSEDNAGAIVLPDSLARAAAQRMDAKQRLAANDGHGFFAALGDLVTTGPTRTNVNDFRAILIRSGRDTAV